MSHASFPQTGLLRALVARLLAAFAVLATALAVASPAQAAPIKITVTDPAGDASGNAALDIVGGSVAYDDATGSLVVSITTKAGLPADNFALIMGLGQASGTNCDPTTAADGTLVSDGSTISMGYVSGGGIPPFSNWAPVGGDGSGVLTATRSGTTVTLTAVDPDGGLKGKSVSCFAAQAYAIDPSDPNQSNPPVDTATGFVTTGSGTGSGTGTGTGPGNGSSPRSAATLLPVTAPVVTSEVDTDRDGVPDTLDTCLKIPGAQKNGCPTMPPAGEVRLGAIRVVIDKLVARTGATCPASVPVIVKAKGKTIGSGKVSTSQFGSFCRLNGVIKLKKHVKAVRVTMTAAGVGHLAKSAHR